MRNPPIPLGTDNTVPFVILYKILICIYLIHLIYYLIFIELILKVEILLLLGISLRINSIV